MYSHTIRNYFTPIPTFPLEGEGALARRMLVTKEPHRSSGTHPARPRPRLMRFAVLTGILRSVLISCKIDRLGIQGSMRIAKMR